MGRCRYGYTKRLSGPMAGVLGRVSAHAPIHASSADTSRIPFLRDWTWTAQVFLTLHTLVLLMKMHSYSFYNGHLSETERRLHALDQPDTASKAPVYLYPNTRDKWSTDGRDQ